MLESDEGAKYLGEVAFVPYNSPISNSKLIFFNTLFDENAACHLAFGRAYESCVKDADKYSEEELEKNHSGMAHGGFVIRSGKTGMNKEHNHIIEYSLKLDSNPEFTTSVLIAYARAVKRLYDEGQKGCKTVLDIAPAYLCEASDEDLRAHLL